MMFWVFKILFFANLLPSTEPAKNIYIPHYQVCHYDWAEDYTCQLELKENQIFCFTRQIFDSKSRQTRIDFVTGKYNFANDTLVLEPSITTNKPAQEKESLSYLLKDNKLSLIDKLAITMLPAQFEKTSNQAE
jgi:hypothetical protein